MSVYQCMWLSICQCMLVYVSISMYVTEYMSVYVSISMYIIEGKFVTHYLCITDILYQGHITDFTPTSWQDQSLCQLGGRSPIEVATVITSKSSKYSKKGTTDSCFALIRAPQCGILMHKLDDWPHPIIRTHKWTLVVFMIREDKEAFSQADWTLFNDRCIGDVFLTDVSICQCMSVYVSISMYVTQ